MGGASSKSERCSTDFAELQARGLMTAEQFNKLRLAFNEQIDTDGEINQQGFDNIMRKVNPGVNMAQLQLITPALYKAYDRGKRICIVHTAFSTKSLSRGPTGPSSLAPATQDKMHPFIIIQWS